MPEPRESSEALQIKKLARTLELQLLEAIERTERIEHLLHLQHAQVVSDRFEGELAREIPKLAEAHGLDARAADALLRLVGLVDWGRANYVPRATEPVRTPLELRPPSVDEALSVLTVSLAGLTIERVRSANRLADLGSGAGFPGLVLAIGLPGTRVTLVERSRERSEFLRGTSAALGLENVEIVPGRAQKWMAGIGACDIVTLRKMRAPETVLEWAAPLVAPGGAVVVWENDRDPLVEERAAAGARKVGLSPEQVEPVATPSDRKRATKHLYVYAKPAVPPERAGEAGSGDG